MHEYYMALLPLQSRGTRYLHVLMLVLHILYISSSLRLHTQQNMHPKTAT